MDPILGGLLSGGASLLGSLFSNNNNAKMMQQQQAYQTQMSNTAYQRASADMTAAGLNPAMMFGSGSAASTPSGATTVPQQNAGSMGVDAMQKAISTATQMKVADATINNLVEQNAKIIAETRTEQERPKLVAADVLKRGAETKTEKEKPALIRAEAVKAKEVLPVILNQALEAENERSLRKTPAGKLLDQAGMAGRKVSDTLSPITHLISSARGAMNWLKYGY